MSDHHPTPPRTAGPEPDLDVVEDGMFRIGEAERFLGLGRSTLYRLMDRGELPYAKIGRTRRIPRRAVVALAARSLVGGGRQPGAPADWQRPARDPRKSHPGGPRGRATRGAK